ncbi:hypothetical protein HELRODRAFT_162562 [Helobdella robusta]|uniref:Uncharacterized protein n=1 Tax=Helobdella robusta TaxID=6412 RepID=T1ESU3_HELRO|nr:hypothetical protein HELRODRAFT_162562 [Helobdella robusta]ESN99079.1 hypothetical protein HELRODRAFT_162562 [Helobdella robusta]
MDVKFHVGPLDDDEKSGDELESNRDEEQELLITHKHNNGNNKNNNNNKSNSSNNKNNNNKNNNGKFNTSSNVICNVNACYSDNVGSDTTVNIATNEPKYEPASHVLKTFDESSHGRKLMHSKINVSASFDEKTEKRSSSSSASEPSHDDDDDEMAAKFKSNPNLSGRRISNMKKSNAEAYVNVNDNSKSNNSDNISNIIVVNISATGNSKEDFYNEINNISEGDLNKAENFTPFLRATNNTNITKNGKSINNNHINHKIGKDNGNMSVPTIGNKAFIHNSKLENLKKIGRQSVESEMGKHFLKPKPDVNMRKWSLTSAPIITVNAFEGDESFSTKTAELQAIFNRRRSSNNEQKDGEPATKTDKNCEEIEKHQSDKQSQRKKMWVDSNDHSFRSRLGSDDSHDQTSCFPNSSMWLLSSQSHAHSTSMTSTDDNDKNDNQFNGSSNRLTAVAKHFFQRRRSHQNCLINTMSPDDEEIITSNANNKTKLTKDNKNNKDERNGSKKSSKHKPKPTGIEAILRQSCSDVRNLLVGDGSLFFSAGGGLSSGGLFQKNRRQSTVGLFQPGPRISPLPFEQHNGTPGMHMRLNYFGVPYMMGPALTSTTSLTTTSSMTSSIAPGMTTTNISPLPQKLATPAIVCDGVLTVPSTLADQQLSKNNTDNNNNISNNTDNNNNSNQLTVNSLDANFLALNMFGSQQQLVGGQARRRSVMLTPRSSFLVTNQPSLDFRDSDLSINYPNCNEDRKLEAASGSCMRVAKLIKPCAWVISIFEKLFKTFLDS